MRLLVVTSLSRLVRIRNLLPPLASLTELLSSSAPSLTHLMEGEGTEPILHVKLAFDPEI